MVLYDRNSIPIFFSRDRSYHHNLTGGGRGGNGPIFHRRCRRKETVKVYSMIRLREKYIDRIFEILSEGCYLNTKVLIT